MDGDEELRFVSYNIPNLHYNEDNHQFNQTNPWRIADEFEIRDALTAIKQAGGKVTRMYTPSIRKAMDDSSIVRHVLGPGRFNEEAFKAYDRVLQVANETGVRVIIPLLDNWLWWGGPREYALFRGKEREEFWTNRELIEDFKQTVRFIVTRVNTLTGVPYNQDKAILAWETGNELVCPFSWTREIAAYIKSLDTNHLVSEGTHSPTVSDEALADPNIDVVSTHYYVPPEESIPKIIAAREKAKGKKPYFVGEFGFISTAGMHAVIDTVISRGVSGIMVWSMRSHNRDGGFYYHTNAYRWPGFPSGNSWDEIAVINMFRDKAFQINGRQPDPVPPPIAPTVLPIETPYKISWQGSTGATAYVITRRGQDELAWRVINAKASDANIGYRPLYADTTVELGKAYYYRVGARNDSGISDLSDPVGPVVPHSRYLIDELEDSSRWAASSGELRFVPPDDVAKAKEDKGRLIGEDGAYIVYALPERLNSVRVDFFITSDDDDSEIALLSGDGTGPFTPLSITKRIYKPLPNEYGMYTAVSLFARTVPASHRSLKIVLAKDVQIGRVEIEYGGVGETALVGNPKHKIPNSK